MKDFAARLEEEAEKKVEKIEAGDLNMIKKSFEASLVLADASSRTILSVTRQRKSSSSRRSNPESATGSSTTARYTTSR